MCGLVAHKIGASTCVITEGNDDVMQILQQNVEETKSSEAEDSLPLGTCLSAKLEWGQGLDLFKETYGSDFEVIIGSDIMYLILHSFYDIPPINLTYLFLAPTPNHNFSP